MKFYCLGGGVNNYHAFLFIIINIWFKFVLPAIALRGGGNVL
jgi:hypothetical protein